MPGVEKKEPSPSKKKKKRKEIAEVADAPHHDKRTFKGSRLVITIVISAVLALITAGIIYILAIQ